MCKVLTSILLRGLEASHKINKGMGKALNLDKCNVSINQNTLTISSAFLLHQSILTIPVENESECYSVGIFGIEKLIKGLKKFNDITSVKLEGDIVTFTDGKKKLKLTIGDAYDIFKVETDRSFTVERDRLETAFNKVKKTVAKEESRPILCGVHFKDNFIETVDGYRVSQVVISDNYFDNDFVIYPKAIEILLDATKKEKNQNVTIGTHNGVAVMKVENDNYTLQVIARTIEGEFLKSDNLLNGSDFEYVIEMNSNKEIVSEVAFIADMLKGESNKKNPMVVEIGGADIVFKESCGGSETKVAADEVKESQKENLTIAFNPQYILDALKSIDDDTFTMNFISKLTPVIIKNDYEKYLILPVRLSA